MADSRPEVAAFFTEDVAYHRALEWRFATGSFNAPGPASAWTRPTCELVAGEPMTPLQHLLVMTDAASGISAALDWNTMSFANVDLSLALHRAPQGEWLGMDAARCSAARAPPSATPSCSTRPGHRQVHARTVRGAAMMPPPTGTTTKGPRRSMSPLAELRDWLSGEAWKSC